MQSLPVRVWFFVGRDLMGIWQTCSCGIGTKSKLIVPLGSISNRPDHLELGAEDRNADFFPFSPPINDFFPPVSYYCRIRPQHCVCEGPRERARETFACANIMSAFCWSYITT